jgi:hypothetical protein
MTFASSLIMLAVVPTGGSPYPCRPLILLVIISTAFGLAHPNLNTLLAGLGQLGLTVAIWAPLFWVPRAKLPPSTFRVLILLLWGFHSVSSVVGVLQVYNPERFSPDARFAQELYGVYADGLKIELADGRTVWRPMGLTDTPGGAAASGQFAFLAGLILAVSERTLLFRIAGMVGAVAGMFCIYLCQIRTTVVLTGISVAAYATISALRSRTDRAALVAGLGAAVVILTFVWATDVGGSGVADRLDTLTEDRFDRVYYSNRGAMLEDTLEKIADYPAGAGLGRWGMMIVHFGDTTNLNSQPLHAEIQATAWLYDGGLILLVTGYAVIFALCWFSVQIALQLSDPQLADWAALVAAMNCAMIANTLTFPVFASQSGMMCLFLNGLVFAAAKHNQPVKVGDYD